MIIIKKKLDIKNKNGSSECRQEPVQSEHNHLFSIVSKILINVLVFDTFHALRS
jgi:hypothetical protein